MHEFGIYMLSVSRRMRRMTPRGQYSRGVCCIRPGESGSSCIIIRSALDYSAFEKLKGYK